MPVFERNGVHIYFEEYGNPEGTPILLIAPGGMKSALQLWTGKPFDPREHLGEYRLIAMDQRNAGQSRGPIEADHGWSHHTADQLGLLDHLGVEEFAVIGMCIGGPYIMGLIEAAPERVKAAVMFQPIGLDGNREAFFGLFDGWRASIQGDHAGVPAGHWAAYRQNMFGGDFLFNTTREQASMPARRRSCLFMGNDLYHPESVSRELASLLPSATLVERWKEPEVQDAAALAVREFVERELA